MADMLVKLAATLLRDAAVTVDKVKILAKAAGWTAEEALDHVSKMLRSIADNHEATSK